MNKRMVDTPATSMDGLIAKLEFIVNGEDGIRIAEAVIEDLRRLTTGR